jgi:hypothetical protein
LNQPAGEGNEALALMAAHVSPIDRSGNRTKPVNERSARAPHRLLFARKGGRWVVTIEGIQVADCISGVLMLNRVLAGRRPRNPALPNPVWSGAPASKENPDGAKPGWARRTMGSWERGFSEEETQGCMEAGSAGRRGVRRGRGQRHEPRRLSCAGWDGQSDTMTH